MLPKIDRPIFRTILPSTGQEIQFQPFSVKEEKFLLIAEMSNDLRDTATAICQIIQNCIVSDIPIENLTMFDMEYLFLQLRSKSIGNIVQFEIIDDEDKKTHEVEVDLDEVKVP